MTQVQQQIAKRAKLTIAPWDGYLKYYNLGTKVPCVLSSHSTVGAVCSVQLLVGLTAWIPSMCKLHAWLRSDRW